MWPVLIGFSEQDWITLDLAATGTVPAEVYGGILAGAVEAFLAAARRTDDATQRSSRP